MNVLITSAAAKVLLVRAFREALSGTGGKVFTADMASECAAGLVADQHFQLLPTRDPEALDQLAYLCRERGIGLIVPTRDGELPFLAAARDVLASAGARVLACSPATLAKVQDKRRFSEQTAAAGLNPVPMIDRPTAHDLPVFIRPVVGAGGRGARRVDALSDLPTDLENYLIHPMIAAAEYSVDVLMDLDGRPLQAVARERRQVVAGESRVTTIMDLPELEAATLKLAAHLGLIGHNVVQAFVDPERGILFIEVNPRFGGASNCSIVGGLASPERILALMSGDDSARRPRPIRRGLTMYRFSDDLFVEKADA